MHIFNWCVDTIFVQVDLIIIDANKCIIDMYPIPNWCNTSLHINIDVWIPTTSTIIQLMFGYKAWV